MKHLIFLSLIVIISFSCERNDKIYCENSIITGDTLGECISHYSLSNFSVNCSDCALGPVDTANIDINQDGIMDLQIGASSSCGQAGAVYSTYLRPLKNTEVSADTSNGNLVFPLDSNVNINDHLVFVNRLVSFRGYSRLINDSSEGAPNYEDYYGYNWYGTHYIGVKIYTLDDTIYSWVKAQGNYKNMELSEYAYR